MSATKSSSKARVARHRAEMRRRGMREVRIWVPDTTAPGFAEEMARQGRALAARASEAEIMDELERETALLLGDDFGGAPQRRDGDGT